MERKPNQDEMEAMQEMVKTQMGFGLSTEAIIRDILGWGDAKGFTDIMILDEIRAYQKAHESKPGSPVIVHSPADMRSPVKPAEKPSLAQPKPSSDPKKSSKDIKTLNKQVMVYAQNASRDRKNIMSLDTLIKMVKTRRAKLGASMDDNFLTRMCTKYWEQRTDDDWKELQ